jgi:hypothetical protein
MKKQLIACKKRAEQRNAAYPEKQEGSGVFI